MTKNIVNTLNDDCLEIILDFLDIKSKLVFANVCVKFRELFISFAKRRHKSINQDIFTLDKQEEELFFKLTGMNIVRCNVPLEHKSVLLLKKYCPNVEDMCFNPNWTKSSRDIVLSLTTIRNIEIPSTYRNIQVENTIVSLQNMENLKRIRISDNLYQGRLLSGLTQLEELEIVHTNIRANYLVECVRSMKNLRVLKLHYLKKATFDEIFPAIVDNCRNLEELMMFGWKKNITGLVNLTKLKRLKIDGVSHRGYGSLIYAMANSPLKDQMEYLLLPYNARYEDAKFLMQLKSLTKFRLEISDERCFQHCKWMYNLVDLELICLGSFNDFNILDIIKNCIFLKFLLTDFIFEDFKQFILDAIEELRLTRNPYIRPPLKLRIVGTFGSSIRSEMLKLPEYLKGRHFIKLV